MPNFRGVRLAAAAIAFAAGCLYAGEHHFQEIPVIETGIYEEAAEAVEAPASSAAPENEASVLYEGETTAETSSPETAPVNLNRADRQQLMSLPGIGEVKAEAILRYREEHGAFESPEELMQVSGIKEGIFRKLEGLVCVDDETAP